MNKTLLPYEKVPQLAKMDIAYSTQLEEIRAFYKYVPQAISFPVLLEDKRKSLPTDYQNVRKAIVAALHTQYDDILLKNDKFNENIDSILDSDTFTVVTAHQPNLFLGPLYFIYKAITVINLAETASKALNGNVKVVPVFVLGSEDHDLEELNNITVFGKKLVWETEEKGAVGQMSTRDIQPLLAQLETWMGESENAKTLFTQLKNSYQLKNNVAEATQAMLHFLMGKYGLIVLNMSDERLKRLFIPIFKSEILEQKSINFVQETTAKLNELGYKSQAAPREINLFYLTKGSRERIVRVGETLAVAPDKPNLQTTENTYQILNTNLTFSEREILAELEQHPERFSPNVVLRPLFQEFILPNLAYVGGGGELAYWLERKSLFEYYGVNFPMLVRRNSVLWLEPDAQKKLQKFGFTPVQFFTDTEVLVRQFVESNLEGDVSLEAEMKELALIFDKLAQKAQVVDPNLEKAVRADEVKFSGALEQWQSRLVRAEKAKHEVTLQQMRTLKEKLFPNNGLQERTENFINYYVKYGEGFVATLKEHLQPFEQGFVILENE
jgi:bacillithiol synthase